MEDTVFLIPVVYGGVETTVTHTSRALVSACRIFNDQVLSDDTVMLWVGILTAVAAVLLY